MARKVSIQALRSLGSRLPLTGLGVAVAAVSLLAFFGFARARTDYVVAVTTLFALGLVLGAVLLVAFGALRLASALKDRNTQAPTHWAFEAVRGFDHGWTLSVLVHVPFIDLSWELEAPEGQIDVSRSSQGYLETVRAKRRAEVSQVRRRFVVRDRFGLAEIRFTRVHPGSVRIHPYTGAMEHSAAFRALLRGQDVPDPGGAQQGDYLEMRPYAPGDPLRYVLWKAYARSRTLMVRMPERSAGLDTGVEAFLVTSVWDEAAAAAVHVALRSGQLGHAWRFGADGFPEGTQDLDEALSMLLRSGNRAIARAEAASSGDAPSDLHAFLSSGGPGGSSKPRLVFLPGKLGPWLESVQAALLQHPAPTTAIIGLDEPPLGTDFAWEAAELVAEAISQYVNVCSMVERETGRVVAYRTGASVPRAVVNG
jgi:hypothetical protein